jgi:hypothetical protein
MESAENIVLKLNEILEDDKFKRSEFDRLINQLKEEHKVKIIFLDFKYYNKYRLRLIRKEKIKNIKLQNFETAKENRDMEKDCLNYISIKTEYKIEKSTFYYEQNYLYYFYLGTAKNDKKVSEYLKSLQHKSLS